MAWVIYLVTTARQIDGRAMDWAHQKFPDGRLIKQTFPVLKAQKLPPGKQKVELPHNAVLSIIILGETVTIYLDECRYGHRAGEEIMVSFGINKDLNVSIDHPRRAGISQIVYEVPPFEYAYNEPSQPIKVNTIEGDSVYQYALTWWDDDLGEFPATFIPEP